MNRRNFLLLILLLLAVILAALAAIFFYSSRSIYLYAWERPEDLSFLSQVNNSKHLNVVYYAGGIVISNGRTNIVPRRNSLIIPSEINKIPVIRVDNFEGLTSLQNSQAAIVKYVTFTCTGYKDCQLDFDARVSEYPVYSSILAEIKQKLPNTRLTMTALASWCGNKSWLDQLSIEEVVPMLYRLGNNSSVARALNDGSLLKNEKCRKSVAFSADELDFNFKQYLNRHSIYLFNPVSWTADNLNQFRHKLGI